MSDTLISSDVTPTTQLEAVNVMLSAMGESPVSSLEGELTNDATMAMSILNEVSKEVQSEGWQWNTEDDYPLKPNMWDGKIELNPSIIRVHFKQPDDKELVLRGNTVFNRKDHTYIFDSNITIYATITELLPFNQLPETARRYISIRATRILQQRAIGSDTLSKFHVSDEIRARINMLEEERKQDRPNMLTGTGSPTGTWQVFQIMCR